MYISFWRHGFEHSKKLEFYKVFRDEYSTSDHLYRLRTFNERKKLLKFKIRNLKLVIELGRSIVCLEKIDYVHCVSSNKLKMKIISCFIVRNTLR